MKQIIKKHGFQFVVVMIILCISNVLATLHPFVMKQILELDFTVTTIVQTIIQLLLYYFAIHLAYLGVKALANAKVNKVMATLLKEIRQQLFEKILKFKMQAFQKYSSSEIYTRLTADIQNLFTLFFGTLQIMTNNLLFIFFMVIMMFITNIPLAVIGTSSILVIALASFSFIKNLNKIQNVTLQKRDCLNKEYSELYQKHKLTYLFGLQKKNIQKIHKVLQEEIQNRKKYIFVNHFMYPVILVLEAIGIYAICYYVLQINTMISVGSVYLVLYYIKQCRSPLEEMFNQLEEMQTSLSSLTKIRKMLKETELEDITKGEEILNLKGDIEFRQVSFGYENDKVLTNISFTIEEGSKVALVGRTGVGKTTLTNILMRLYEIKEGTILIGGHSIKDISIKSLRKSISYISQNPYIFSDTIRNNITFGNEKITDFQIQKLAEEIGAKCIFEKLEKGLDEVITQSRLSYGELQVISFIRAILHPANIYIFDEPTSNIDLKTESMIQNCIERISKNSTVIIIAHRKATIRNMDKIIYLKDGQIDVIKNKVEY